MAHKKEIRCTCSENLLRLSNTDGLEREADRLHAKQDIAYQRISRMAHENAEVAQGQDEYNRRVEPMNIQYESLKAEMIRIKIQITERQIAAKRLGHISGSLLTAIDESVSIGAVDQVVVRIGQERSEKWLNFRFKDGSEIPIPITV